MKRLYAVALIGFAIAGTLVGCSRTDNDDVADTVAVPTALEVGADAGAPQDVAATADSDTLIATVSAPGDAVALVNGEDLRLAAFQRQAFEAQHYYVDQGVDPNTVEGQQQLLFVRRLVLLNMINQALIEQSAAERGITVSQDELAAHMAQVIKDFGGEDKLSAMLAEDGSTREEFEKVEISAMIAERLLEAVWSEVGTQGVEFAHVRHVLCDTREACVAALGRLEAGEDFAVVAAEVSIDEETKDKGGDLQWMPRGLVPSQAVEDAIFALQAGERSGVIESEFGYQVLEVLERDSDREVSDDTLHRLRQKALEDWLAARRAESQIEIYVDDLVDVIEP